jgi:molecular chaperone DnaK
VSEPTALGIDLGTTLSVVAQVNQAGLPVVLPNAQGALTTPSVVLFDRDTVVVGSVAREALATEPELVVQLVKRHMGSDWTFEYRGVSYGADHVSAIILRKLLADAQALAGPVSQAAVTVPAYFNDPMRSATRRAAELAGIQVLGLLSEPTAAALAFGYERRPAGATGVVVDLGGGTFDVTVMDFDGDNLAVRATGGDYYLGGANFDAVLFDYFVDQFRSAHGVDINDPEALSIEECTQVSHDWLMRATTAKEALTSRERTTVVLQAAGLLLRVEVARDEFLARSSALLDEVTERILDVMTAGGVSPKDVGFVLAVGGSTRIPAVRKRVQEIFGREPDTSVRPDEAVAMGAALFAAHRQLEQGGAPRMDPQARDYLENLTITDVAAHTLGISVFDSDPGAEAGAQAHPSGSANGKQVMLPLLPRNAPLPFDTRRTFYTMRSDERRILVPILEGEDSDPELCRRIGEVVIDGLPPYRPEHQKVLVAIQLDRDGILRVAATDVATGQAASTTIVHEDQQAAPGAAEDSVRAVTIE